MKWLTLILAGLLILFQYLLWFGDGGIQNYRSLKAQVKSQTAQNLNLQERNRSLAAEVKDLKSGLESVEARARLELGMIGEGEVFYQVIKRPPRGTTSKSRDGQ